MPFDAKFQAELRQHYAEMHARNEETRKALAQWRPSDALDSQGRVNGSDLDEGFFGDMENFRQREMGAGFDGTPEEMNKRRTPGSLGLEQSALSDGNQRAAAGAFTPGNSDPNDRRPDLRGHGATVADDLASPSNVNNFDNAAGRRGLDSLNDEQQSETARWWRQAGGHGVTDADGVPPGGAAHSWIKNYPAAGRGLVRGARFYGR